MSFDWVNLETLAVALGISYLLLAMRENSLCWYCAFFSTAIYVYIFGDVSLYMESALNVYYMGMAVYGWLQWQKGGANHSGVEIVRWTAKHHIICVLVILIASVISGYLLSVNTDARLPYLDSFTTWASVLTTVMVARKVLENWLYWIVINSVSIYLYIDRDLDQTAAMFTLYLVLSVLGYVAWKKNYVLQDR
ncbi:MAG: nicotinamide mononucleotide transporter [Porticoccaceae bacterium]|jgi:nicotinamide mononucleotide transporter|nr:nicotinamide mononucleotide transporter [Porticoccaceae bacterium]MDB9734243.1 nicotinamide riboside transporter PnuC [Porticoccaceae bacterium]